jgi:hypothetical protein
MVMLRKNIATRMRVIAWINMGGVEITSLD